MGKKTWKTTTPGTARMPASPLLTYHPALPTVSRTRSPDRSLRLVHGPYTSFNAISALNCPLSRLGTPVLLWFHAHPKLRVIEPAQYFACECNPGLRSRPSTACRDYRDISGLDAYEGEGIDEGEEEEVSFEEQMRARRAAEEDIERRERVGARRGLPGALQGDSDDEEGGGQYRRRAFKRRQVEAAQAGDLGGEDKVSLGGSPGGFGGRGGGEVLAYWVARVLL